MSKDFDAGRIAAKPRAGSLGGAVIGAHLRRLSERIDRDANRVYAHLGIAFEQRWMGVLDLLAREGPLSVNEIAAKLRISHPSVSQTRSSLLASKIVAERSDPIDGRRRIIHLTSKGTALVDRLTPVWQALELVGQALNEEAGDAVVTLNRLEAALDRHSILNRVAELTAVRA